MLSTRSDELDVVRHAYDLAAEDLASRLPDVGFEDPLDLAMVDAFARSVAVGGRRRVLDAGCGGGRMSRYLTSQGCLVEGVDLSAGMVAMARRDHPDLQFTVGSLSDLPYDDDEFMGVMLWYSIIHTPPAGLARVFDDVTRVLRPGGHVLVGFHSGAGVRDVPWAYQRGIQLDRHLHTAQDICSQARASGLHETARMVRRPRDHERDEQCVLLLQHATDLAPA